MRMRALHRYKRFVSRKRTSAISFVLALTMLFLNNSPLFACAVTGTASYQPWDSEVASVFERAGSRNLGGAYPQPRSVEVGHPQASLSQAQIPCVVLKSIGFVESSWGQAVGSVPDGSAGPTKVSPSCGYGIMQITSGMRNPAELPTDTQRRIAEDYVYNIAWGTGMLVDKWNTAPDFIPPIGVRDPSIAEDWYYAVWAYNSFSVKNNPNNPDLPWPRPAFNGTQSRTNYPYQELVWGFAANPPRSNSIPLWDPVPLTLPKREEVGITPQAMNTPQPSHTSPCNSIMAAPSSISLTTWEGKAIPPQNIALDGAISGGSTAWSASASSSGWLSVSPASGSGYPSNISVAVNPSGLPVGSYRGDIVVSSTKAGTVRVQVELKVVRPPKIYIPFLPNLKRFG